MALFGDFMVKRQNRSVLVGISSGMSEVITSFHSKRCAWPEDSSILPKRLLLTRLETRTKESNHICEFASAKTHRLNESKYKVPRRKHCSIDRPWSSVKGSSKSIFVRTRKMVNYAWVGWSQGKLWWRLVAILTCKSFVKLEYRGERLIEPSSSWFPLKFLSG